jgi:hypothetical protein
MPWILVSKYLEDAQRSAQRQAQDGEYAQRSRDLQALLGLDQAAAVRRLGQNLSETRRLPEHYSPWENGLHRLSPLRPASVSTRALQQTQGGSIGRTNRTITPSADPEVA